MEEKKKYRCIGPCPELEAEGNSKCVFYSPDAYDEYDNPVCPVGYAITLKEIEDGEKNSPQN